MEFGVDICLIHEEKNVGGVINEYLKIIPGYKGRINVNVKVSCIQNRKFVIIISRTLLGIFRLCRGSARFIRPPEKDDYSSRCTPLYNCELAIVTLN
jgi:hypothetical protein